MDQNKAVKKISGRLTGSLAGWLGGSVYEGGEGERYFLYKIVLAVIAWPNRRCGLI